MNDATNLWKALESMVVRSSTEWLEGGLAAFKGQPDMEQCYRDDHAALMAVAALLGEGRVTEAAAAADALDTIVRDVIPDRPWQVMHDHAEISAAAFKAVETMAPEKVTGWKSRYYRPMPNTVFIPFWSEEAEQMFRDEAPGGDDYIFSHHGGNGLVYMVEDGTVSIPMTRDDFWHGVCGNETADCPN